MDPISRTNSYSSLEANNSSAWLSKPHLENAQFIQLLMGMLGDKSGPVASSGLGSASLISPILLNLFEAMISNTINGTYGSADILNANSVHHMNPRGVPVHGPVTQEFHPGHNGLDFGVATGTPVEATMTGRVISAGWNNEGYGNLVVIQNGDIQTFYAHLSDKPVQVGQLVQAGETIGYSGNTGHSTGPHLHYEVRKYGIPIDPTAFTLDGPSSMSPARV